MIFFSVASLVRLNLNPLSFSLPGPVVSLFSLFLCSLSCTWASLVQDYSANQIAKGHIL